VGIVDGRTSIVILPKRCQQAIGASQACRAGEKSDSVPSEEDEKIYDRWLQSMTSLQL